MDKSELLRLLSRDSHARKFSPGEAIVREGDSGSSGLGFLLSGEAKVIRTIGEKRVLLGFIKAGQFFGETALVLSRPRLATVEASSEAIVFFVNPHVFKKEISHNFLFLEMLLNHSIARVEYVMAALTRLSLRGKFIIDPGLEPIIQENRIHNLRLQEMLNHTRSTWVGAGKPIFSQGDRNDGQTYLVVRGTVAAVREQNGQRVELFTFQEGDIFGYSHKASSPIRRYATMPDGESARIISLDDELLTKLMRMNQDHFFFFFRTIITQLVILDDALRHSIAPVSTTSTVIAANDMPPPDDFAPDEGCDPDQAPLV